MSQLRQAAGHLLSPRSYFDAPHCLAADTCDATGGTVLKAASMNSSYTWTATQDGEFFFICSLPDHCSTGNMQLKVTVSGCSTDAGTLAVVG